MSEKLKLTLRQSEGALLRTLGTVQRRGHEVTSLVADFAAGSAHGTLDMTLAHSPRDIGALMRQLAKLYDVVSVQLQSRQLDFETAHARRSAA